jgi:hypothetical protein
MQEENQDLEGSGCSVVVNYRYRQTKEKIAT